MSDDIRDRLTEFIAVLPNDAVALPAYVACALRSCLTDASVEIERLRANRDLLREAVEQCLHHLEGRIVGETVRVTSIRSLAGMCREALDVTEPDAAGGVE